MAGVAGHNDWFSRWQNAKEVGTSWTHHDIKMPTPWRFNIPTLVKRTRLRQWKELDLEVRAHWRKPWITPLHKAVYSKTHEKCLNTCLKSVEEEDKCVLDMIKNCHWFSQKGFWSWSIFFSEVNIQFTMVSVVYKINIYLMHLNICACYETGMKTNNRQYVFRK